MSGPGVKDLSTYQAKVGFYQGADRFFIKEDGFFQFDDQEVTGTQLKAQLYTGMQKQIIGQGAGSTLLSVVNYPGEVGMVVFSMTSTMVTGAFAMVSGVKQGEEVLLKLAQGSTQSGEVTLTFSGCSYIGLYGSVLNSVTLQNSVGSAAYIKLKCFADDEWTAIDFINDVLCEE
jgi:hypothetical protein